MNTPNTAISTYSQPVQEMIMQKSRESNIPFATLVTAFQCAGENKDLFLKAVRVANYTGINVTRVAARLKMWADKGELTMHEALHYFPEAELDWPTRQQLFKALFEDDSLHS